MSSSQLVSSWVQTIYYGITIRAGEPKPAPGSARFASDRRLIQIGVIAVYLLYTFYEADYDIRKTSSFYTDLGVPLSAGDRDVKSRFRRLAALHHPDKAGSSGPDTNDYFIHLKLASEVLQDAAKRFAYERFGPVVVQWQKCITIRDYVSRGVTSSILPHYGLAVVTLYILGVFGYMNYGTYYRWLVLVALCTFELHAVTRPAFPAFVDALNTVLTTVTSHPPFLPFQIIVLARKLTITSYIALSQIGPLLAQHLGSDKKAQDDEKALQQGLERLETITRQLDADTVRLMDMEMAPFKGDPAAAANLQGKMREWLVQNTIRADPMVRDALGTSFRKRRIDAPAGAKGNR